MKVSDFFSKDYAGEAIHMLRNNQLFYLNELMDGGLLGEKHPGKRFRYTTLFPNNVYSGDKIIYNIEPLSTTLPNKASIKADDYNTSSGKVKVRSTVVYVEIVENVSSNWNSVSDIFPILIYIHDFIQKLWISPNTITLVKGLTNQLRFEVFAAFGDFNLTSTDNSIIANINKYYYGYNSFQFFFIDPTTGSPILDTNGNPQPTYRIGDENSYVKFDLPHGTGLTDNNILKFDQLNDSATLPATITVKVELVNITGFISFFWHDSNYMIGANATLIITNPNATLACLSNHVPNSLVDIQVNRNLMILGDGFTSLQSAEFNILATQLARFISRTPNAAPWSNLNMHIFSCHIPSREDYVNLIGDYITSNQRVESGKTICDIFSVNQFIHECDKVIENEIKKKDATTPNRDSFINNTSLYTTKYNFANYSLLSIDPSKKFLNGACTLSWLVKTVGMPTSVDLPKSFTDKIKEWRHVEGVYNDAFLPIVGTIPKFKISGESSTKPELTEFVFHLWKKLALFIHVNRSDTAHFSYFNDQIGGYNALSFDNNYLIPNRIAIDLKTVFNKFISKLKFEDLDVGLQFFNPDGSVAKDANNILLLSKIPCKSSHGVTLDTNKPEYGFVHLSTIDGNEYEVKRVQKLDTHFGFSALGVDLQGSKMGFYALNTALHELNHNFIDDEYSVKALTYDKTKAEADKLFLNLNAEVQLKSSPTSSIINYNKIRWLWPRIEKILYSEHPLELSTTPGSSPKTFTFRISRSWDARDLFGGIKKPNKILLRREKDLKNATYIKFEVSDVGIDSINLTYDDDTAAYLESDYLDKTNCYVILPRWDGLDYQRLIHKQVLNIMSSTGPLVASTDMVTLADSTTQQYCFGNAPLLPKRIAVNLFKKPINKTNIIGLYAGGDHSYTNGIFHPAGFCIMRSAAPDGVPSIIGNIYDDVLDPDNSRNLYIGNNLCHVCRYIVVDELDKMQHPLIDKNYDYPTI